MSDELSEVLAVDKQAVNTNLDKGKPHRWKPGQSGNPNGRPKKNATITSLVRELLEQEASKGKTNAQVVAGVIVDKLKEKGYSKGYPSLLKDQQDRLEGKVTEEHNISLNAVVNFTIGKGYAKADKLNE